jgi:hypothetical protein
MAEVIDLVQGDTYTPVSFNVRDKESADLWENTDPLNLDYVDSVVLKFKSLSEDRVIAEIPCEFVYMRNEAGEEVLQHGKLQITDWGTTLQCDPGVYQGELETRRVDGKIQSVHNLLKFKVRPEF